MDFILRKPNLRELTVRKKVVRVVRNKKPRKIKPPSPFHIFPGSTSDSFSSFPTSSTGEWWGCVWGCVCGQTTPQAAVLQDKLCSCCSFLQGTSTCSSMVLSMGCRGIPAPALETPLNLPHCLLL